MSYIRYKKFGNKEYAYEITSYWDSTEKKPRQKSKYLGIVVDKEKEIFEKRTYIKGQERLILDFGDTYLLYEFMKNIKLTHIIEGIFKEKAKDLLALICYRLCHASAMSYARIWYEGNISRLLFKDIDLSSQRINEVLKMIGDEGLQREFFKSYVSFFVQTDEGVIIDTTGLPNGINLPFNVWGYNDGETDKQIRFLFVVDKNTSLPLYFRYLPGNIVDVSSLNITIEELNRLGIRHSFVLIDAGFFSEENIRGLYSGNINFLTRLPSTRVLYKDLIREEARGLERINNAVRYGKRVLFIKEREINLYGRDAYAYVVFDPERKGREIRKLLLDVMEEQKEEEDGIEFRLMNRGIMILVSSFKIQQEKLMPLYYMRQTVERLFGFSKDDLKLIPLRIQKEGTLRGYLLFIFIALTVFLLLKKEIGKGHTVEEILLTMRNLKCKGYDNEVLIQELTRQQKEIIEKLNIIVPKSMGI